MMKTAVARLWLVALVMFLAGRPALAQSAIAGVVRDSSGAVLPGVTVEASSPALIEKIEIGRHERGGPVPDRRPPPRHLQRLVHAERLRHGGAGGHPARGELHGAGQRGHARRVGRRERHRHRREPGGRRADEPAPAGGVAGNAGVDSHRPQLRPDGGHDPGRHHRCVRRRRLEHDVERRQPAGARLGRRRLANAHRRDGRGLDVRQRPVLVRLRQRSANAGNGGAGVGRRGRAPAVGRAGQPHSEIRRQPVHRRGALPLLERQHAGQQRGR